MAKEEQMNQDDAVIILTDEDGNETSYLMLDVVEYKDAAYAIRGSLYEPARIFFVCSNQTSNEPFSEIA